jgi:hypothetical protein
LPIEHFHNAAETSIRASAAKYNVPYTTLRDRLAGTHSRQESHQNQQILLFDEEISIVKWIQQMDDWGFPPKISVVKEMAGHLAQTRATGHKLGRNWLSRFLERHPEVASRFADRLDRARNSAGHPSTIRDYFHKVVPTCSTPVLPPPFFPCKAPLPLPYNILWLLTFSQLRTIIREHSILPDDTYNMDEKGFAMGQCDTCKVICRKGRKIPQLAQDGTRTWVTVVEAVSAVGKVLPPMIINEGAGHYYGWYAELNEEDQATFAFSPNGWTDSVLGLEWLRDNFDKYTREGASERWRLLLVDGHVSHVSWQFFDYALKHKIQPFCLPSKSTHILQPLDVGLFSPLQKYYMNAVDNAGIISKERINKGVFLK